MEDQEKIVNEKIDKLIEEIKLKDEEIQKIKELHETEKRELKEDIEKIKQPKPIEKGFKDYAKELMEVLE